jgi:hypothetical protein
MLGITARTRRHNVQQVRIIPRIGFSIDEVIYRREPTPPAVPSRKGVEGAYA